MVHWIRQLFVHPRRGAWLIWPVLLLIFIFIIWPDFPHKTVFLYSLGEEHKNIVEMRIAYLQEGEAIRGVHFRYPTGAPLKVRHTIDLPHGRYQILIEMTHRNRETKSVKRVVRTPADAVVHINTVQ